MQLVKVIDGSGVHAPRRMIRSALLAPVVLAALAGGLIGLAGCHGGTARSPHGLAPSRASRAGFGDVGGEDAVEAEVDPGRVDSLPPADARRRRIDGREVRVRFAGNASLPAIELLRRVWIDKEASPPYSPGDRADTWEGAQDIIARDVLLLHMAYYDWGYVQIRVGWPEVTRDGGFVDIVFPVEHEGPRMRVRSISLVERGPDGVRAPSVGIGSAALTLQRGAFFSREVLVRDLQAVRRRYEAAGFVDVRDDTDLVIDEPHGEVDVTATILTGGLPRGPGQPERRRPTVE